MGIAATGFLGAAEETNGRSNFRFLLVPSPCHLTFSGAPPGPQHFAVDDTMKRKHVAIHLLSPRRNTSKRRELEPQVAVGSKHQYLC